MRRQPLKLDLVGLQLPIVAKETKKSGIVSGLTRVYLFYVGVSAHQSRGTTYNVCVCVWSLRRKWGILQLSPVNSLDEVQEADREVVSRLFIL